MKWLKSANPFDPKPYICNLCGEHSEFPDDRCPICGTSTENPIPLIPREDKPIYTFKVSFMVRAEDPDDVVDWLNAELRDEDWGGALMSGFKIDKMEDADA